LVIILTKSELFGKAFEQFIFQELIAYSNYKNKEIDVTYWRTASGFKVDFILNQEIAIEVKASSHIQTHHLKGLNAFYEEYPAIKRYIISLDVLPRISENGIQIMPWQVFLTELWNGTII